MRGGNNENQIGWNKSNDTRLLYCQSNFVSIGARMRVEGFKNNQGMPSFLLQQCVFHPGLTYNCPFFSFVWA